MPKTQPLVKFDDICAACGNPGTHANPVVSRIGADGPAPIHASHPETRSVFPSNWDDYLAGRIELHELNCVLCDGNPCTCRTCEKHQLTSCGCRGSGPSPLRILEIAASIRNGH
jgi:hypothetical protein